MGNFDVLLQKLGFYCIGHLRTVQMSHLLVTTPPGWSTAAIAYLLDFENQLPEVNRAT